jgi:hypothetical protein
MHLFVFVLLVSSSKNDTRYFSYADVIATLPWPHPSAVYTVISNNQTAKHDIFVTCTSLTFTQWEVPSAVMHGQKRTELLYVRVRRNVWSSWPSSAAPHGVGLDRIGLAIAAASLSMRCFRRRCAKFQCKSDMSKEAISVDFQNESVNRLRLPGEAWVPERS